jgi:aspartate ammonia-lyase
MENAVDSLCVSCVRGITANVERSRDMVLNSLGIVTLLKPSLGYKQCAEIAREGYETGKSLHDIVVKERKLLTQQKWDEVFSFENLIDPKFELDASGAAMVPVLSVEALVNSKSEA